jgi:hypothetical protein
MIIPATTTAKISSEKFTPKELLTYRSRLHQHRSLRFKHFWKTLDEVDTIMCCSKFHNISKTLKTSSMSYWFIQCILSQYFWNLILSTAVVEVISLRIFMIFKTHKVEMVYSVHARGIKKC